MNMTKEERARRLRSMLAQIAPKKGIQEMQMEGVETPFAELPGVESAADARPVVESGLRKLAQDRTEEVTSNELYTLEAIVLRQNRPVVFVRGASYDNVDQPWLSLNTTDVKDRISRLFPSIGRVELPLSSLVPYGGTGFVVGKGLLMTNRHVAQLFSKGLGLEIRYQTGGSAVDFKQQIDTLDDRSEYLKVVGVEMIHPYWDMALLRVDGLGSHAPLPLSVVPPEKLEGRNIVIVGYPAKDYRNDIQLQDQIFGGKYNVKRLQPGVARARARIQSFENVVNAMTHDASTLGGNSGSAVVDVDTGEIVALHFAGEYLKANYAVPMFELARDRRVAPLLNFDGNVPPVNDWEPAWQRVEESEGAAATTPPSGNVQSPATTPPSAGAGGDRFTANWNIPIQVTVSIGQPTPAIAPVITIEPGEERVVVDQDYSDRPGYDPDFLGFEIPLPVLTTPKMKDDTAVVIAEFQKSDPYELPYYHYSVYMNKRRRTAWFSAANVDGTHRPAIGKREGDRWYRDTRISDDQQLSQKAFEHGIDRGHLTRREDTAWGKNVAEATRANNDTFHFTNCSLQASLFNRGKDRWQGLEQFLLEQHAKKDKRQMVVITGPVFAANDPVYQNESMNYSVRCPIQFWKVCVLISQRDEEPSATGFILGQEEIQGLPGFAEAFDVAATQVKIADLEKRTKLDFGDLKKHDHFAQSDEPGTLELPIAALGESHKIRAIRNPWDIVI